VNRVATVAERIRYEVAYVDAGHQFLHGGELADGATVADALADSGIAATTGIDLDAHDVGIWSKPVARSALLRDGDRVEVYRPLQVDPKEARRARAASRR